MKRRTNSIFISILIIVAIICSSCTSMKNRDIENGIVYTTYSKDNYSSVLDITSKAGKNVVIPAKHNGLPVKVLNERKSLYLDSYARYESLILPETIERINDSFYYNASTKLQYNEYDNGLYLGTEDNPYFAFIKVKEVEYADAMSYNLNDKVDLPEKEGLPPPAYLEHDTDVETVTIHPDTKIIANNAFAGCEKLKSVTVPGSIKTIPSCCFAGCTSLKSVVVEEGVEKIMGGAFLDCDVLEFLSLPSTLKEADYIFADSYFTSSLLNVSIGEGMEILPEGIFKECVNLKSIVLPESLKTIPESAFYGCSGLETIKLPSNLENIGNSTFMDCSSLCEIELPSTLKEIGERTFENCTSLAKIEFSNSLTHIGMRAFYNCALLESISIPKSIESIGANAFGACEALKIVKTPPLFTYECASNAFLEVEFEFMNEDIKTVTVNGNVYSEDMTVLIKYGGDPSNKFFRVPDGVVYIGENAFRDSTLENIILPDSVRKIGMYAFYNCDGITSFTTPPFLSHLGDYCFKDCDSLEYVIFSCVMTSYPYVGIFDSCDSLKTIRLCGYVEFINIEMFKEAPVLEKIDIPGSGASGSRRGYSTRDGVLYNYTSYEFLLYYPQGKKDKIFTVNDTRYIQDEAFKGNKYIEEIYLSDTVVNIENGVFEDCTSLKKVVLLGEGLRIVGDRAFKNCVSLKEIKLTGRVESVGASAFEGCTSLESVVLGDRVGWIRENAFRNCSSLKSVELGSRSEFIYDGAFLGCYQLEKIVIPEKIGKIMGVAFEEQVEIYFEGKKRDWEGEKSWWGNVKKSNDGGYWVNCSNGALWVDYK